MRHHAAHCRSGRRSRMPSGWPPGRPLRCGGAGSRSRRRSVGAHRHGGRRDGCRWWTTGEQDASTSLTMRRGTICARRKELTAPRSSVRGAGLESAARNHRWLRQTWRKHLTARCGSPVGIPCSTRCIRETPGMRERQVPMDPR
jgi:hypothetical protein